ncbi:ABC transporter substrate-binding protein [Paenarthrobacter sp. YJN-D]|uniref:ABC transporter substrate-binding protein n=1 Tax=Paenarthrobacter sp. YJN-D TaxID=2735317 RepID=UPI001878266E|nr:ABC transporter substrate-binding protein [Paenarthrobacter sp. YJN-D]QOT24044.1 ABC transporter substrate-binding protein [Paenarthrobacter sp. YJN-D]
MQPHAQIRAIDQAEDAEILDRWWVPALLSAGGDRGESTAVRKPFNLMAGAALRSLSGELSFYQVESGSLSYVELRPHANGVEVTILKRALPYGLTLRELQVLSLVSFGLSNVDIANRLGNTRRTIGTHVERILLKMGVESRSAAAAVAVSEQIQVIPIPGDPSGLPPMKLASFANTLSKNVDGKSKTHRPGPERKHPLIIGGIYPTADLAAEDGAQMRMGAELAIAQINQRGGVQGRSVVHLPIAVDVTSATDIERGVHGLLEAGADALTLGYSFARNPTQMERLFTQVANHGAPLMHSQTSQIAASIVAGSGAQFRNIFQVCAPENRYGLGFLRVVTDLADSGSWNPAGRRLAIIDTSDPSMQTWDEKAASLAERLNWKVTVHERVDPVRPNWPAVMRRLRELPSVDAIFVACFLEDPLLEFLDLYHEAPLHALVYTTYVPSLPDFLVRARALSEGLLWSSVIGSQDDVLSGRFASQFKAYHLTKPGRSSAGTHYDMVQMLAGAWSMSDSPRDWKGVSDHLRESIYRGVNGIYAFDQRSGTVGAFPDDTEDPTLGKAHLVFQIQDGDHRLIFPAPYGVAKFRSI